jgi:hypothetical protein
MATLSTPPISPGVGARRRGPKSLPTLPLSAFSPPNTGISDSFPLPQSPTTVHPESIVDASVRCSIPEWKEQINGSSLGGGRVGAVVVKTKASSESELEGFVFVTRFFFFLNYQFDRRHRLESQASQAGVTVLAVSVPFNLESGTVPSVPSTKFPVIFSVSFESTSDAAVAALRAALSAGHTVEIDVQGSGEDNWERLEDLLTKATADGLDTGLIILCECSA